MASGERTQSDVESDEEFEEMTSNELWTFYFKDFEEQLVTQLRRKRLDRIDKILEILAADQSNFYSKFLDIYNVLKGEAFERMPIGECSELVRIIFRHLGQDLGRHVQHLVIKNAVFYNDRESLDTVREIFGRDSVDEVVLKEEEKFRSRSPLLSASLHGDVAEVKRLLAAGSSTRLDKERTGFNHLLSEEDDLHPVEAAADFGHTAVVDALLPRLAKDTWYSFALCCSVWSIACRRSNFEIAARVLSAMGTQYALCYLDVTECLEGTPEFFKDTLPLVRIHLRKTSQTDSGLWEMLEDAIEHRQQHHVEILLDEIDQDGSLSKDYLWDMRAVHRSRSTAILRDVLTRYPEAPTSIADCDPLCAIQEYHWPVGARLLVEAGAKIKGTVPSNFVGLLSLSLEDRCRIVVRRHMKLPLCQNVDKLPLPRKVKRRLLYHLA